LFDLSSHEISLFERNLFILKKLRHYLIIV